MTLCAKIVVLFVELVKEGVVNRKNKDLNLLFENGFSGWGDNSPSRKTPFHIKNMYENLRKFYLAKMQVNKNQNLLHFVAFSRKSIEVAQFHKLMVCTKTNYEIDFHKKK